MGGTRTGWLALEAPAKINLGLRVMGRREDGYHLIESVFVPLDLVDDLRIEIAPSAARAKVEIDLAAADSTPLGAVPADGRNLAAVAAEAYLDALPAGFAPPAIHVSLRKRIPAAAGLGGGSSDAGAVLRALSVLIPEGPQGAELARLALGLGADVPYFLCPRPALVTGIGECIEPLGDVPALVLALVNPGVSVATADVYRVFDALSDGAEERAVALTPFGPGSTMPALSGPDADVLARLLARPNDLVPAAVRLCPVIARLGDRLGALGALGVGMSGSGATVYGVFSSEAAAHEAMAEARFEPPIFTRVARSASGSGPVLPGSRSQLSREAN